MAARQDFGRGKCQVCDADCALTANGRIRTHGPRDNRCAGGSDLPKGAEEATGDLRPYAREFRDANTALAAPDAPADVTAAAEEIIDRATKYGTRPDHGGPNPHRAPVTDAQARTGQPGTPAENAPGRTERLRAQDPAAEPEQAAEDPAEAFLNGGPSGSSGASGGDADAFLDGNGGPGGDDDEEEDDPPYFPARYDGSCSSCGDHFDEGDQIRADGSGGWEGEDCCGDSDAEQDKPLLRPKLRVVNGRYHAPNPHTGKKWTATRATNFVKKASDRFALELWGNRMTVLGLVSDLELGRKAREIVKDGRENGQAPYELAKSRREALNRLVDRAKTAAGASTRANKGTILHTHTEKADEGTQALEEIPDEFVRDVVAYRNRMETSPFAVVEHLIERSTAVLELGVVGTFDRILKVVRDVTVEAGTGNFIDLKAGDHVIGDVKTGADLDYNWMEIIIQLALYANGVNTAGIAVPVGRPVKWSWQRHDTDNPPGPAVPEVRNDVAIVMHMPYGEERCLLYAVDIAKGWEGAQLCQRISDWQRTKTPTVSTVVLDRALATAATGPEGYARPSAAQMDSGHPSVKKGGRSAADVLANAHGSAGGADLQDEEPGQQLCPAAPEPCRYEYLDDGNGHSGSFCVFCDQPEPSAAAVALEQDMAADPWPVLEDRFDAVTTKAEASALYQEFKDKLPAAELKRLVGVAKKALERAAVDVPLPSPERVKLPDPTWEDRFSACREGGDLFRMYKKAESAGLSPERLADLKAIGRKAIGLEEDTPALAKDPQTPAAPPVVTWEQRFGVVKDRAGALDLYRQAKADSSITPTRLADLVGIGKEAIKAASAPAAPPEPTWEDRFAAVKDKAEASALYREVRKHEEEVGKARILELIKIGQSALIPF